MQSLQVSAFKNPFFKPTWASWYTKRISNQHIPVAQKHQNEKIYSLLVHYVLSITLLTFRCAKHIRSLRKNVSHIQNADQWPHKLIVLSKNLSFTDTSPQACFFLLACSINLPLLIYYNSYVSKCAQHNESKQECSALTTHRSVTTKTHRLLSKPTFHRPLITSWFFLMSAP